MKGYLKKWTNYRKGYQLRWFVLENGANNQGKLPLDVARNPDIFQMLHRGRVLPSQPTHWEAENPP